MKSITKVILIVLCSLVLILILGVAWIFNGIEDQLNKDETTVATAKNTETPTTKKPTQEKPKLIKNVTSFKGKKKADIEKEYGNPTYIDESNWQDADTKKKVKIEVYTYEDKGYEFYFFKGTLGRVNIYPKESISAIGLEKFDFNRFGLKDKKLKFEFTNAGIWRGFKDIYMATAVPNMDTGDVDHFKFVLDKKYR